MTTYKHIVQVHPVENGEVNLAKYRQISLHKKTIAENYVKQYNATAEFVGIAMKAVYRGRVNDITGELE
jgi:hypothetical protein